MKRIPEPELMNDQEQAEAYASADFENSNTLFITMFKEKFPRQNGSGTLLDLGCGPGDITLKFAHYYPEMVIHGVDGAKEMMARGISTMEEDPELKKRMQFIQGFIPGVQLPVDKYAVIISNSLLHHLHEPAYFWQAVRKFSKPGSSILVMDLKRPENKETAKSIINKYSATEPTILRMDFYNSLLAAFEPDEIKAQLKEENFDYLNVEIVSDRHLLVWGTIK